MAECIVEVLLIGEILVTVSGALAVLVFNESSLAGHPDHMLVVRTMVCQNKVGFLQVFKGLLGWSICGLYDSELPALLLEFGAEFLFNLHEIHPAHVVFAHNQDSLTAL